MARCTVERLIRKLGIEGVIRGQRRRTTVPEPAAPRPPNLVSRRFTAERPNQLWLADLTYIRAWSGWVYVAFVLDACSRRIVADYTVRGTGAAGHFTDALCIANALGAHSRLLGALFAVVLLDASITGAAAVTLATNYPFGDMFNLRHSLHRSFGKAKAF